MSTIRVAKREKFTIVDRRAILDDGLSFRALGVLVWLLDKPDDWKIDAERLCAMRKEGRDAVRAACKELVEAGYMVRDRRQDSRGRWSTTVTVYETPGRTEDGFPGVGNPTVGEPGANTKTETDNYSLAQLPLGESEDFDAFWTVWPKRVGKGAARKAYARALRRTTPAEILVGACRVADAWKGMLPAERQFVPYPEKWLNADRWLDEPEIDERPTPRPTWRADTACEHCAGTGWRSTHEGSMDVTQCECRVAL